VTVNGDSPVVGLDIDGTLGDYHRHFLAFATGWLGKTMPAPEDINPGLPLHRYMRVSKARYRECKLAYRQGGMKRSMPAYPGARELTQHVRKKGAAVWICTTRPYLRLDNIDPDTRAWLRRNGIQYDGVLFGERKYAELARIVTPARVLLVVDDLVECILAAQRAGIAYGLLRDQPYNRYYKERCNPMCERVHSMRQIQQVFDNRLVLWNRSHHG
jgi:phosphoglycolate phosphatase-like HAD superfamily hydrolase